jgi:hypothetical protein
VIEIADIRRRWRQTASFLDERARRLFAANEALAQGHGGVTATSNALGARLRRPGGGRKSAVTRQPELPTALEKLIEDAIPRRSGFAAALGEPQPAPTRQGADRARLPGQPARGQQAAAGAEL